VDSKVGRLTKFQFNWFSRYRVIGKNVIFERKKYFSKTNGPIATKLGRMVETLEGHILAEFQLRRVSDAPLRNFWIIEKYTFFAKKKEKGLKGSWQSHFEQLPQGLL
jgi:hypothetical protein